MKMESERLGCIVGSGFFSYKDRSGFVIEEVVRDKKLLLFLPSQIDYGKLPFQFLRPPFLAAN